MSVLELTAATLLILDDHPLFLDALKSRLEQTGYVVAAALSAPGDLVEAYRRLRPDLVLVDLSLPGVSGCEVTAQLLAQEPDAKVVALSAYDDTISIRKCLEAGACGFISKQVHSGELNECLQAALAGQPAFDSASALKVLGSLRDGPASAGAARLSGREREILQLVADGYSTGEIAERLFLSPFTVKSHIAKTLEKLGVSDRAGAVAVALRAGAII